MPDAPREAPTDDAPKRRGIKRAPLGPTNAEPAIAIEDVPAMIRASTNEHLENGDGLLLVTAPPGSGKTTEMVRLAEEYAASGHRVLYAGPNHDFFQDLMRFAARPAWWYEWKPRTTGDDNGMHATCRWAPQMDRWLRRNYDAMSFCSNPRICGWNYVNNVCPYHAQRKRTEPIIFIQHQHVALGHALMEHASLLIGDELPLSALLWKWHIPTNAIVPPDMEPGPIETILRALRALAQQGLKCSGPELLLPLGGAAYVESVCSAFKLDTTALAYAPELRTADGVDDIPYFHLPYLISLLNDEAKAALRGHPYVQRVLVDRTGLTLLLRRPTRQLPPHIIWCDATGDARLYERMLRMPVQTLSPRITMRGRVFQVWSSLNNKGSVLPEGKVAPKLEQIQAQIERIIQRGGYERPAIISYKDIAPLLRANTDHGHFWAERGTNKFQDCDCLIVVGAPQPTIPAIVETAAMLYQERMESFDPTWTTIDRPFDGQAWSYPIGGFWNDPDLQLLLEQFRESEIVQAVHRARPLRRVVDIWLLTNAPVPGLPVELVSLHDLFDAPDKVDPYRWPAVVALAEERYQIVGRLTTPDIADHFGVSRHTATKWFEALLTRGWREIAKVAGEGRGPRARACVKGFQDLN